MGIDSQLPRPHAQRSPPQPPAIAARGDDVAARAPRRSATTERRFWLRATAWFAALNGALWIALGIRYLHWATLTEPRTWIYAALALVGHFGSFAAVLWIAAFAPLVFLLPRARLVVPVVGLAASAAGALLLLDLRVYDQYRFHLSRFAWELLRGAGSDIFSFSWFTWMLAALVVLAIGVLQMGFLALGIALARRSRRRRFALGLAAGWLLALGGSHLMHLWYEANYDAEIPGLTRHLPLYYPATGRRDLLKLGWVDVDASRERAQLALPPEGSELRYPASLLACENHEPAKNVLFLVIDSWRFDTLAPDVTPNVARLAGRPAGFTFTDHYSGGSSTRDGIFALFYGLPSSYWDALAAARRPPVLMDRMRAGGYALGIFGSATLISPAFDQTVFARIPNLRTHTEAPGRWQADVRIVEEWLEFVERRDPERPFFGFLFFDAAHAYQFPPDYPRPFQPMLKRLDHLAYASDMDPLPYFNRFKTSIHFVDSLVGRVLNQLEAEGLLDSTVIVVTSDHGEEFDESAGHYWGHGSNFTRWQTQVPLVVHWPGRSGRTVSHRTSHYDVAPTLVADIFGCAAPASDYATGRHLLDDSPREWIVVGSYVHWGLVQRHRIVSTDPVGGYSILDPDGRVLPGERLEPGLAKAVLGEFSRFYR